MRREAEARSSEAEVLLREADLLRLEEAVAVLEAAGPGRDAEALREEDDA